MAGILTQHPAGAGGRDTAGALIGMRRTLARNSPGGSGTVVGLRVVGLALGWARCCSAWSGSTTRAGWWTCWQPSAWPG